MPKKRDKTRPRSANLSAEANATRDRVRNSVNRWRGSPPGIPPELLVEFEARVAAGETIRDLTSPPAGKVALVSNQRFRAHCKMHPEWSKEIP
jgi:hypothetical protein